MGQYQKHCHHALTQLTNTKMSRQISKSCHSKPAQGGGLNSRLIHTNLPARLGNSHPTTIPPSSNKIYLHIHMYICIYCKYIYIYIYIYTMIDIYIYTSKLISYIYISYIYIYMICMYNYILYIYICIYYCIMHMYIQPSCCTCRQTPNSSGLGNHQMQRASK